MPTDALDQQTPDQAQPIAQPQAQAVPDPAHVILSAAQTDDKTKADAWEIYHNHEGQEFESKLHASPLPQDAKAALWDAKTRSVANAKPAVPAPQKDLLTQADETGGLTDQQSLAVKAARGVRGLYHGVMGDEETAASKGQTTTASPEAASLGFTPEHIGYKAGEMLHGVGKFGKEAVQDIGTTPVVIPDKGDKASFADPKAHTLVAKYVTAPSMAERQASQDEMQKYFETKGPAAAGHAISAFLHGTLGEYVPVVGPLAMSLEDQAQKGDLGGALAQLASLYAVEKGTGAVKEGIKDRINAKVSELTKTPEVKQAEANVEATREPLEIAQQKHDAAMAEHNKYSASHAQGIDSPKPVKAALEKAQAELDEAQAHHDLAKEHLEKNKAAQPTIPQQAGGAVGRAVGKVLPTPAPMPEVPTENVEAAPVLTKLGEKVPAEPALAPINVKTPGQVQPETFPQEPKPAPRPSYGRITLPNEQGTMGTPKLLTEGTPEGPQIPKGGLPKINLPEEKPAVATKPTTDEAALRALSTNGKGEVVETPEKKIGRLLQEALKPEAKKETPTPEARTPEAPTEKRGGERRVAEETLPEGQEERRQNERRVLQGMNERAFTEGHTGQGGEKPIDTDAYAKAMEQARKELGPDASVKDVMKRRDEIVNPEAKGKTGDVGTQSRETNPEPTRAEAKVKPVLPKEEPTGYTAKKEEVVPAGVEGREPVKSAAEYHPAVEQKINELSDDNLKKLAKAHGLNPDEYDFKARDARRHRTERDQLAKDITEQIGEDEKINLGRAAESAEKEPGFANRDQSAKGRADRAAKLFPRLRGPVDEFGNPKVSGGAPEATGYSLKADKRYPATNDVEAEKLKEHIGKTSSKDTDHVQNAMKELGPDAKLSDIMRRAQEMKAGTGTSAATKVANSPTVKPEELKAAVDEFNKKQGKPPINSTHLGPDTRQEDMAEYYKKTPHTPDDPEVKKSYDALKKDVDKQYELAKSMGFKFDGTKGDTYSDSFKGLKDDVNNNKHVLVWQGADFPADHPLSEVDPKTGFTYAEKLLAIHDLFGHVAHDKNFTVNGEENAWNMHRQMFSPEAQAALATETRGRGAYGAKYKDFTSKAMLMPEHLQVRPEEVTNKLKDVVNDYNKKEGRPPLDEKKIDVDSRQQAMADAYDKSKHEPNDPEVKKSYDSLKKDIDKQYALAEKQGYKFDAKDNDPYEGEGTGNETSAYNKLRKDAVENKHISAWKGGAPPADHPLSEVDPRTGLTYNEKLRSIHDLFGHVVPDNDFTGKGEENAWNAHRQMFSKESLPALATETRGQTAYVEKNGKFADQRATLLPKEFHTTAEEHATDAQLAEHEKNGGSTFSFKGKDLNGTDKYSVGVYPDRTEQVDKLTPERLEEFKKKNADVLSQADHAVGTWKDPDTGKAVLDVAKLYDGKDEAIAAGKAANQKAIFHLGGEGEIQTGGTGRVNDKGSPVDEFGNPTVSGGAPEKKLPTGDALIKKYGESNGDPKDLTFILKDGRGVANTGIEHDHMLGGRTDEKVPPRERFIAEGNIRVRPRQGAGGREVAMSIPESGVTSDQLKYIQKMSPQLRSGAVMIEVGKPGGAYKAIPYGEASPEQLETVIRGLGPVLNDKGSPIDWNGNPTVSGGSPSAGTGTAKVGKLPKLAEEHLTEEEKAGVTKTPRTTEKFVEKLSSLPKVKEFVDAAVGGQGARKWYQRSRAAIDAITKEAPEYFTEPEDLEKFTGLLAASSPRQSVAMNIREALNAWKEYVDADRPEGKDLEKLLKDNFTNKGGKVPNAMKAMEGKPMWPDLTKNRAFKVPSFRDNLLGTLHRVTNDGWMALFSGLDPRELGDPDSYHPISVLTREAAKQLNWEPAEAQAAIWSFVKTFKEHGGETSPEQIRHLSEDMADIVRYDPETRSLLSQLKVNLDQLDRRIESNTGEKPEVTRRPSSSAENSARKLSTRIKEARGEAPTPKDSGLFDLKPEPDEATEFNPETFGNEKSSLEKLGKKKSPYGKIK